jgi:hypothetical protein
MEKSEYPDICEFDIYFFLKSRKIDRRPIFFARNACFYMICEPELFTDPDYARLYDELIFLLWKDSENEWEPNDYKEQAKSVQMLASVIFREEKRYREIAPKRYIEELLRERREVWEMIDKYGYS